MKALILTCNTGEGHNQTAKAIIEEFQAYGHECNAVDSLTFLSEEKSKFLCDWHKRLYRHLPRTSSVGYSVVEKLRFLLEKEWGFLYKYFAKGADKLNEVILSENYDIVISVHPFSAIIIAGLKSRYKETKVKTAFIATDYTCSPGAASGDIDTYFIPHTSLEDDFFDKGVKKRKMVFINGIPVNKKFYHAPSRDEAKELIGVPSDKKVVLFTCGSMGCGPISKLTSMLSQKLPENVELFVVCGTNEKLRQKLGAKKFPKNVTILGYTDKMIYYSAAADVYITKPGGISSTEAAVLGVPTLLINAVGGCETHNCNFFTKKGSAKTSSKLKDFVDMTLYILDGDEELLKKCQETKDEFSKRSAKIILNHYFNLIVRNGETKNK